MPRRAPARATLASCALALTTLTAARAGANATSLQGTATANVGWTDNILNAPDESTPGGAPRLSDFFFQLMPRVTLTTESPRFIERLAYNFTANLFVTHFDASSYASSLDWTGNLLTSPTTKLILTLTSLQGKYSSFSFGQSSAGASIDVLPPKSDVYYFNQTAGESLEATPRASWRVAEQLKLVAFIPLERGTLPDSYDLTGELGFDRLFRADALGLLARAELIDFVQPRNPMTDVPIGFDQRQVLTSLVARWRRDWSPLWSTEAALGAVAAVGASADPMASTRAAWEPSALAAVRWTRDIGAAELRYTHDVVPNALVGNSFSRDGVTLQAGFPVVRARMFFGATAGYQHARILALVAGVAEASADIVLGDATIGWQPIPELGLSVRYSYMRQLGTPPFMGTPATLPDITRNLVMLGLNVTYPATVKARVSTRPATRVDHADQPDFPETHAAEPQK